MFPRQASPDFFLSYVLRYLLVVSTVVVGLDDVDVGGQCSRTKFGNIDSECHAENGGLGRDKTINRKSSPSIPLFSLEDDWINEDKLIFIESSGRENLPPRYLCAVESALRFSGLPVVVFLTSPRLDVASQNGTKQIIAEFPDRLLFRHADPEETLKDSPFGHRAKEILQKIQSGPKWIQHLSDALRLAIIYKYGGWYADLDTIFLRPLSGLSPPDVDVISTDGYLQSIHGRRVDGRGHRVLGGRVSNGLFRVRRAGSRFLRLTVEAFDRGFDPDVWTSGGANAMGVAIREICQVDESKEGMVSLTVERISAERCDGLQLFDPKHFFPKSWFQAPELWSPPLSLEEWESAFADSFSVDFFQSSVANTNPVMRPHNYGKKMPAYAALGSTRCPIAFFSKRFF